MNETLRKTWGLFTPPEQRKALLMLALVVLMALVETLGVVSIMPFLSVLGRPEVVDEHPLLRQVHAWTGANDIQTFIVMLGLASMVVVVLSSIFKTVTIHLLNRFIHLQRHSLSSRLLGAYLHQPYEFFLGNNSSTLSKNVLSEVDQVTFELLQPLSQLIAQGAIVLAMVLLVFAYDPLVAVHIVATVTVLYGTIYLFVRKRLARIGGERQAANAQRYQACNEALSGIKEVKVTQSEAACLQDFSAHSRNFSRHFATAETLSHSPLYLVEAVGYSGLIGIALYLLIRSNDIAQVLPALGLYGFSAYRLLPAVQIMYRGFARLRFSSASLHAIHHDLSLPITRHADATENAITLAKEIRLHGIHYTYPSARSRPVLKDLDLQIPINTSLGISGRSGSGKSTLMDILLGLLEPQAGTLTVDGIQITRNNLRAWQRSIGYVPQHVYLTDASIAQNIAFGVKPEEIDVTSVLRAARIAQIHDFITKDLPDGYDTRIGERGVRLSGGQRQRLGIARALYRDPPVLFMDEATSALDPETEAAFNSAIEQLSGRKTVVIIAHKESSLRSCQEIIELSDLSTLRS
ncbi:ABC transporter ATP-binding protein [Luteimonas sp. Sa2BVA3]|uniref:ABC transporter ATP-binding protein n=1 Tax=Luteimonas colneyensis TaxID=2762230 RepID=A0ABR8UIU4_9GAMM|nr:ABC transporter ATP-binding protein [Luteimonas colneyensis]MBD7987955.1 ABC transporter ATP-binding protein [Luteimonas colneyensis]